MPRTIGYQRFLLWAAVALFLGFVVTEAINRQAQIVSLDLFVLRTIGEWRSPNLDVMFLNLTALGSLTIIVLQSLLGAAFLASLGDRLGAMQLLSASATSYVLTQLLLRLAG